MRKRREAELEAADLRMLRFSVGVMSKDGSGVRTAEGQLEITGGNIAPFSFISYGACSMRANSLSSSCQATGKICACEISSL